MKKVLIASVSLNLIILLVYAGKRYYYAHSKPAAPAAGYPFDNWNIMRTSLFSIQRVDTGDIVFVGNSLTEAFPVTEMFGSNCKNRGISGNKTAHILKRIALIAKGHPKKLFIEAGINDFVFGGTVDSTFNNYIKILGVIKRESPRTLVYVQSTLPTCGSYEPFNISVIELNEKLREYCKRMSIRYIDIYSPMVLAGKMDSTLTADGLHLNGKGYDIWQHAIAGYVK